MSGRWPWDSPFAWAMPPEREPRRRLAGVLAGLLARIRPPAGRHHAVPEVPAGAPPPCPPSWDGSCSPGAVTLTDFTDMRVPPYIRPEDARHGR